MADRRRSVQPSTVVDAAVVMLDGLMPFIAARRHRVVFVAACVAAGGTAASIVPSVFLAAPELVMIAGGSLIAAAWRRPLASRVERADLWKAGFHRQHRLSVSGGPGVVLLADQRAPSLRVGALCYWTTSPRPHLCWPGQKSVQELVGDRGLNLPWRRGRHAEPRFRRSSACDGAALISCRSRLPSVP